jgi:two-component system, NarL family, nitrate/nitrite response regulator NarL
MTTRLLLVDDHPLVRHGLRLRLESVPSLQVVSEASCAEEAMRLAQEYEPDIAVVDLGLPGTGGLELTTLLLQRAPNLAVLIMTMYAGDDYIVRAVDAGARGYILKDAPIAQVVSAIEALAAGGSFFSHDAMRLMKSGAPAVALSERQRQILDYLVEGYSNKEIARLLDVSVRTVESHRLVIKRKLGAERAVDLLRRAVRLGFTQL